jgi:hypothetical protein
MRSFPFFLRANRIGAPYGEDEISILLSANKASICFFSSSSSSLSNGYNFLLGGGLVSSTSLISC